MLTAKSFKLNREKTIALLHRLEPCDEEAISLFLPSGMPMSDIETILKKSPVTQSIPTDAVRLAGSSQTGSVFFWGLTQKTLISPPFPLEENYITNSYDIEPLLSLLTQDFTIGIVLVRLGHYCIGICHGEQIVDHYAGTGLVHGRHRQGGSSAARFQRRRQDQTHHFLKRVCEHIGEKFEPERRSFSYKSSAISYSNSMTDYCRLYLKFQIRALMFWRKLCRMSGRAG
jgi:hypothetical protein